MFRKILIANRGEIALQVLRACRTLGIEAVVVYSEADRDRCRSSLPTRRSASAPPTRVARASAPAVISAALVTDCDAIHPGYGFLSEDEGFADVVAAHGLTFIGPPADVLERFGSKGATRRLLGSHGLPTIPGSDGMLRDDLHALGEAERIGYLLIKPSAGGGARACACAHRARLESALRVCRSRGEGRVRRRLALPREVLLDENRHVEVQVAVDRYGRGVHLGERDCSVQRRHQKIIEEAPTPALTTAAREDLADPRDPCCRRRRVREHRHARVPRRPRRQPVFHRDQLPDPGRAPRDRDADRHRPHRDPDPIAAGEPLGFSQSDVELRGHAIEFRINAEDPAHEFRPATGVVERYHAPGGPGVRMDSHLYEGYEVPPFYDSLLGKLIVWGPDREAAIARGRVALDELLVEGIATNVSIHKALLANEAFLEGHMTTNLLDRVGAAAFLAAAGRP